VVVGVGVGVGVGVVVLTAALVLAGAWLLGAAWLVGGADVVGTGFTGWPVSPVMVGAAGSFSTGVPWRTASMNAFHIWPGRPAP
jgi:hypothetical protein